LLPMIIRAHCHTFQHIIPHCKLSSWPKQRFLIDLPEIGQQVLKASHNLPPRSALNGATSATSYSRGARRSQSPSSTISPLQDDLPRILGSLAEVSPGRLAKSRRPTGNLLIRFVDRQPDLAC
jgi:hypothetical protein